MRCSLLLLLLLVPSAFGEQARNQDLALPEAIELGRLTVDETRPVTGTFKNTSHEELEITGLQTSCSCANVKLEEGAKFPPGAERKLTGSVAVGSTLGNFAAFVTVSWRRGTAAEKQALLPIRGVVVASFALDRSVIDFGKVDLKAGPQSAVLELRRGNADLPADGVEVTADDPHLTATVEKLDAGGRVPFRINVRLDPSDLPISAYRAGLTLHYLRSGEALPETRHVPVSARLSGPLEAAPATIYLGAVSAGALVEKQISIRSGELDLRSLVVEKQPGLGRAELEMTGERNARLKLTLTPDPQQKVVSDSIILFHRESRVRMVVPVLGALKPEQP